MCTSTPQFGSFWASFEAWKWTGKHSHKNVWQLGIKPDVTDNLKDMSYFLDNGRPKEWKIIEKELKILPHELTHKLPGVPHFNMLRYVTNYLHYSGTNFDDFYEAKFHFFLKFFLLYSAPNVKSPFENKLNLVRFSLKISKNWGTSQGVRFI